MKKTFNNPFRAGAGHAPPYLAGRESEKIDFGRILKQTEITDNPILTGLRGVGKTVLLEEFKKIAITEGWLWVGTDMSESAALTQERLAIRLLADLAVVSSMIVIDRRKAPVFGFDPKPREVVTHLNYDTLIGMYHQIPGLGEDKLKAVFEFVHDVLPKDKKGIVFAYDEAQKLSNQPDAKEFPLSDLINVFQSIQSKGVRFMLVLAGLPTLFPKLVEVRTSAERMFHLMTLDRLDAAASREAIVKPIREHGCPIKPTASLIDLIVKESGGYPYFIQFISREVYDVALQKFEKGEPLDVSIPDIIRKLDTDFFDGRWLQLTDRQRELLKVVAYLPQSDSEFTVQEIVLNSKAMAGDGKIENGFSPSHVNQMLAKLSDKGLIYKKRAGRYSFSVPLMERFIRRQA